MRKFVNNQNSIHKILPKHIAATLLKSSLTSNENTKPRNSTMSQRANQARTPSSKTSNLNGSPIKSAHSKQETSKTSQYNIKNLNR